MALQLLSGARQLTLANPPNPGGISAFAALCLMRPQLAAIPPSVAAEQNENLLLTMVWIALVFYIGDSMPGGSVLIVDSDRSSVRQLAELLSVFPLQVFVAHNKAEAQELALCSGFDLCLMAHGLVDGNGLTLLGSILRNNCRMKGVLLVRHADLRVVLEAVDAGATSIITYPVDAFQLRPIISRVFPELLCGSDWGKERCERKEPMVAEHCDLKSIAALSIGQIRNSLANADLIRIIRTVDYPFAGKERLEYFDRDTLERVVCLVRRWSQQRLMITDRSLLPEARPSEPIEPTTLSDTSLQVLKAS